MKKSSTNKSSLRKLVLASLAAGPVALVPTLRSAPLVGLPDTAVTNLTAPSGVTTTLTTGAQNTLTVRVNGTSASNTILSWVDFGGANAIGADGNDALVFTLPTADSAVLNKVVGTTGTTIGSGASISSNGKIFILNPNGVTVSGTAQINAAAFVASAIADTDTDTYFAANGSLHMNGGSAGNVTVSGTPVINVGSGNVVLAGSVMNVAGTITGNLQVNTVWTGGTVNLAAGSALSVTGNVSLASSGANIELAKDANTTITGGNLTVDSTGTLATGTVSTTNNTNLDASKSITVKAGTQTVGLQGGVQNVSITSGGAVTLTATGNVASVGVTSASSLTVNAAAGSVVLGNVTLTGALTTTGSGDVTLGTTSVGGNLSLTSTTGNIKSAGTATVAAGKTVSLSATTAGKSITFQGGSDLNIAKADAKAVTIKTSGTIDATAMAAPTVVGGVDTVDLESSAATVKTGAITVNTSAKFVAATDLTGLGALTAPTLTLTSTGGAVTDSNAISSTTATVSATKGIKLDNAANTIGTLTLTNTTANAVTIVDNQALVLGTGTSVVGDASITTGTNGITFGANAASDTLSFGKLTLASNTTVTEAAKTLTTGNLAITATGVTLNGTGNTFGTVSGTVTGATTIASAGALTVDGLTVTGVTTLSSTSTVGLGAVTVNGGNALSVTGAGGITSTGVITASGTSAFDLTSAGDITLNTANKLTGAVSVGAGGKVANATVKNDLALAVASAKVTGNLTLTTASTGEDITQTGAITVPGTLTVNTTGTSATTLTNVANALATVTLGTAGSGAVQLNDVSGGITVGGMTSGALTVTEVGDGAITFGATSVNKAVTLNTMGAGDITINGMITGAGAQNLSATTANGMIHLGSFYSESGGLTANTTATAAMGIDDVDGARANIYGDVDFETKGGAIALTNWSDITTATTVAHRFGGITANTVNGAAAGANVTIYEGGTERVKSITAGAGNVLLQASCNDTELGGANPSNIISSTVAQGNTTITTTGNVTLYARNSVVLNTAGQTVTVGGNLFGVANTNASLANSVVTLGSGAGSQVNVTGTVDAIASSDVTISTVGGVKLGGGNLVTGDFYAGGNLNVLAGGAITQDTALLRAKGSVTLNAGANAITLGTSTNEFGGMDLTGGTVTIKENGTTRLVNANVTNLTVTSTGDIIGKDDNTETINVGTLATFNPGGNLTLKGNNQFNQVKITATGATQSATINDTVGNTTIVGGSSIGGNLTVTNTAGAGVITQDNIVNGAGLTVGGTVGLTSSATGGITVSNPNNSFGKVRFSGGSANVDIEQNNSLVLVPGSTTVGGGNVTLRSINGTLSNDATGTGSNSFAGNVTLQAMQNVSILNEWFVAGTLTITTSSGMVVDLSGLSKSVDLHGSNPVVNGGTLKAGTPNP